MAPRPDEDPASVLLASAAAGGSVDLSQHFVPHVTLLEGIRKDFADILKGGTFEQTSPLPEEANDVHLADMPRLKFRFDRHKLGKLRLLIDRINAKES